MTFRRRVLLMLLFGALALALALKIPRATAPVTEGTEGDARGAVRLAQIAPDEAPPGAARLVRHARARIAQDVEALVVLTRGEDYAAYRSARDLATMDEVAPDVRLAALERVLRLRIDDPLDRAGRRELYLEIGTLADQLGQPLRAIAAHREALPASDARRALERLVDSPYQQANIFLQADMFEAALEALDARAAPSIEAPAYRALDRHEDALDAYRRWLRQVPGHREAREGIAWSHWYLENLDEADAAFAELDGPRALYGRALVANERGDVDAGVKLLRRAGRPEDLWLATTWLERADRHREALELYLELSETDSDYADDAAYRAYLLAGRMDDGAVQGTARERIPEGSYFSLRLGGEPALPDRLDLPDAAPEPLLLAAWLAELGDEPGARGVLSFALRDAMEDGADAGPDEAAVVALGEALAALGEYRRPSRAAMRLISDGSPYLRTWRLAWPKAWRGQVHRHAKQAEIDANLVWAIMRQESAFFPGAVSRSGAQGLMQVMPSTWDWLAELQEEPPGDPFDPATNIRYGAFYLGWLQDFFRGDLELVVPSYNRGQGYIQRLYDGFDVRRDKDDLIRMIDAFETREYLQAVWRNVAVYRGLDRLEAQRATKTDSSAAARAAADP